MANLIQDNFRITLRSVLVLTVISVMISFVGAWTCCLLSKQRIVLTGIDGAQTVAAKDGEVFLGTTVLRGFGVQSIEMRSMEVRDVDEVVSSDGFPTAWVRTNVVAGFPFDCLSASWTMRHSPPAAPEILHLNGFWIGYDVGPLSRSTNHVQVLPYSVLWIGMILNAFVFTAMICALIFAVRWISGGPAGGPGTSG